MKKLKAFHGDKKIKAKYIARVKAHQKADEIIKGRYWTGGKGCAVGCTIEGNEHLRYETELGIPQILAHLEDGLFEEMLNKDAMKFPLRFLEAIPVGADLSKVFTKLVIWEWEDKKHGLKNINEIKKDVELYDCCERVVMLYKRVLNDEEVSARLCDQIQAVRVAWRIVKDWVVAQMALVDTGMVKTEEVFLPYLVTGNGQTLFQKLSNDKFMLGSGK